MHWKHYSEKISIGITRLKEVQNAQFKWNSHGETRILSCEQISQGDESQWGFFNLLSSAVNKGIPRSTETLTNYISHLEKFPLPTPTFFFFFFLEAKDCSDAEGNSNFAWICLESLDFFNTFLFVFAVFINLHSKRVCWFRAKRPSLLLFPPKGTEKWLQVKKRMIC